MIKKHKQPIELLSLLNSSSGTLAQISAKTNFLTKLSDIVRQNCPDLPENAWKIANFRQNIIILEVKTAVWGQRLQFERMKLTQAIAIASNQQFTQLDIKVNPHWASRPEVKKKTTVQSNVTTKQQLSQSTANQLIQAAENAPDSLKQKLLKLAAHGNKN